MNTTVYSSRRLWLGLMLMALMGWALLNRDHLDVEALAAWVAAAGWAGPLLFIGLYAIATVLFLPGSLITLAGGALFGPFWGSLWNLTGATLGAGLAFLVARYLAGDWVEQRVGGRLKRLRDGVRDEGWRFVALVRLVPLFPFNLLNYALGLTGIPLLVYLLATWMFMLPGAIAYTWLGHAGREAMAGHAGLLSNGFIALGLLAMMALLPRLVTRLTAQPMLEISDLKQRLDQGADLLLLDVRTAEDFIGEQGHLPAARNLPLEVLPVRLDELASYRDRPILLICRTDRRSARAAQLLTQAGFVAVWVIRGGMTAWQRQGWPVELTTGTQQQDAAPAA